MSETTYDIILCGDRLSKPINLCPGYDMNYVRAFQYKCHYNHGRMIEITRTERQYDDLSIIRFRETPQ